MFRATYSKCIAFFCLSQWVWTSEKSDNFIKVEDAIHFGQEVDDIVQDTSNGVTSDFKEQVKKSFNVSSHVFLTAHLDDGRPYGILDGLLGAKSRLLLKTYLTYNNDAWLFNNYDEDGKNKQRSRDNVAWLNEKDPLHFSKTKLCRQLAKAAQHISKDNSKLYPYRVFGKIIRRGDHTLVSADSNTTGDVTALVFVNEFWRKNFYGELYLYDNARDITGGATHRPGRVVIYDSTILRLNRPPAVQFQQGQLLFQVQFSKSKDRMENGHKNYLAYLEAREKAANNWFLPNHGIFDIPNPEKHKTREYTTTAEKRKIFVYDKLFPRELLDHLRDFVLKFGRYFYDDSFDKESDNVQWIAALDLKPYLQSPYWKIKQKIASHATGSDKMFPYDISINLVRSSDFTRVHEDVAYPGEEEFTCLVYLNPGWDKNFYGETTFFERNSDDTEIVAQVRPRYGRTVIFDGNIPHSARPPSFNFTGARLTFVTKFHRNEYTARKKNFQQEHGHFAGTLELLGLMNVLSTDQGGSYAKLVLDEIKETKARAAYYPDRNEDDDNEDEDDEEGKGNEAEKENKESQKGTTTEQMESEEPFFNLEDAPDPFTLKLVEQLRDVTELSPGAVERIKKAEQMMQQMQTVLTRKLGKKIVDLL